MSDRQLRLICYFALTYFLGSVLGWVGFGIYLWYTGRM